MRITTVITPFVLVATALAQDSTDELMDSLITNLVERAFNSRPVDYTDVDDSTLGKAGAAGQLALPSSSGLAALSNLNRLIPAGHMAMPRPNMQAQAFHYSQAPGFQHVPLMSGSDVLSIARTEAKAFNAKHPRNPVVCRASGLNKLKVEDVDMKDKRVFVRVDFNVPQDKVDPNIITNTARIDAAIPTIKAILNKSPKSVVLASHLGRPDGMVSNKFSMEPVAKVVQEKLGVPVTFIKGWGPDLEAKCTDPVGTGQVFLLDNLRFNVEEEGKGKDKEGNKVKADEAKVTEFRKRIKSIADIYVNDAFGTAHRAHSSMVGEGFDVKATGQLMAGELDAFAKVLDEPKTPVLAILGGAKVTDKIQLIFNMLDKVDKLIIGGGMAFTFLKVIDGMTIGSSLYDDEGAKTVKDIMDKAKEKNVEIILPVDFTISSKFGEDGEVKNGVTKEEGIPDGFLGLDCGPKTNELNKKAVMDSKTIIWNGPMGVFEMKKFEAGTKTLMDAVVESTAKGAVSVIGGGDTATACKKYDTVSKVTHCSTGGGASMELLEGKLLPGVAALSDAC